MAATLRPLDKLASGLAFLLGLATILGALASQYIGGLYPCELCLEQRMAYYIGLPILLGVLVLWNRLPLALWFALMAIATAIFAWGTYMASYHAGVEWGFWPGPTACTGVGESFSFDQLNSMTPVIGCDVVQFRFLGLSLAGYNALISLAIVVLLAFAMVFQARRKG
ncbi:disulfide bond formation protein B [Devosia sp. FJ2-5-3]|jgi:disulfide bond formation protein DsbB|uniref:disulfide bond formation protein B n=1 Tax=Devosia sp. FJ2-5-3 TaxID=2976680 RepID=UPI0023D809E9|nr:disulfide bond formation protein B [Devosia sp. FJ2-5-3]WEJ58951.1 disulfide bond formation protein B [Devosia sp. FJ2-5-3]